MHYFQMMVKVKEYKEAESLEGLVKEKLEQNSNYYGKMLVKQMEYELCTPLKEYEPSNFVQFISVSKNALTFIGDQLLSGAKHSLYILCEIDREGIKNSLDTLPKKEKHGFIFGKKKEYATSLEQENQNFDMELQERCE